jgi:predicted ester cyclase
MPTPEESRELVDRFTKEVFNNKNLQYAEEVLSDDFVEHQEFPGITPDKKGAIDAFRLMFQASPDLTAEINEVIVSGERVAIRGTFRGTDTGGFAPGMPPTNKPYVMESIDIVAIGDDGKFHEHWGIQDTMGVMAQLGLAPSGPPPA